MRFMTEDGLCILMGKDRLGWVWEVIEGWVVKVGVGLYGWLEGEVGTRLERVGMKERLVVCTQIYLEWLQ